MGEVLAGEAEAEAEVVVKAIDGHPVTTRIRTQRAVGAQAVGQVVDGVPLHGDGLPHRPLQGVAEAESPPPNLIMVSICNAHIVITLP